MTQTEATPDGWDTNASFRTPADVEAVLQAEFRWFAFRETERPLIEVSENSFCDGGLRVGFIRSTGYEIARFEDRLTVVTIPMNGRVDLFLPHADAGLGPGDLLVNPPGRHRLVSSAPGGGLQQHLGIEIEPGFLAQWADVSSDPSPRWLAPEIHSGGGMRPQVQALIAATMLVAGRVGGAGPLRRDAAVDAILTERILDLREMSRPVRIRPGGLRQLKAAESIIHARFREPLCTPSIAREIGLSVRSLQDAFLRHRGVTPQAYLRRVRLEAADAQLALCDDERSVTDIALGCGFVHLSRFAAAYRRRFGMLPSQRRTSMRRAAARGRISVRAAA